MRAWRIYVLDADRGVLSEWVLHSAGLPAPGAEPPAVCRPRRCARRALVLTARRLLLFDARPGGWVLAEDAPLSGVVELAVPPQSPKLLVLRQHGLPDAVLSMPAAARARLLAKFQSALGALGGLRVHQEASPVVALLDEHRQRAGALTSVGAGGFVVLPYAPALLDMSGEDIRFFGVLDLCESDGSPQPSSAWHRHLVALKAEAAGVGLWLLWCPQAHCGATPGALRSASVLEARAVDAEADSPEEARRVGDEELARFSVRGASEGQPLCVMLQASAVQTRDDWMAVLSGCLPPLRMR
ncbi:unnamed protein product [Prorocentrum cordatum]|uniref:PH domain-containing protein n=1 Tax=Prorocentrum cordatum TaxID=2364126 RepID=A0ABN9R584_9DINO|nr:unnamed protein product [Polarella glacialis]